jgi:hypothetical protein
LDGERRSFALLRPISDISAQECIGDLVLQGLRHARSDRDGSAVVD